MSNLEKKLDRYLKEAKRMHTFGYTVQEVHENHPSLSIDTIKNLIHLGELKATKIGKQNFISKARLIEMFERGNKISTDRRNRAA